MLSGVGRAPVLNQATLDAVQFDSRRTGTKIHARASRPGPLTTKRKESQAGVRSSVSDLSVQMESSTVQKQIQQDWENREFIEVVSEGIKKIAEFLNDFGESSEGLGV